jgi:hypothetical protein
MTSTPAIPPPPIPPEEIWCAIPVYNNAPTIQDIAQRARAQAANVLVIDDGSTDADLRDLLQDLDVRVVRHPANRGKGAALQTAFDYVRQHGGRYLVTLDGDGQHFPEDIPRLLAAIEPHTIVIGCRVEVVGSRPSSSHFGQDFSDFWIQVESGAAVRDTQSGFRVYPLEPLAQLPLHSLHYTFEVEVLARAIWAGLQTRSVPIRVSYSDATRRASSFRPGRDNLRLSWLHTRLVARQILPFPHSRIVSPQNSGTTPWLPRLLRQNASPLGLAASIGLGCLHGIVAWPLGILLVLYVSWRLHLNKPAALAAVVLPSLLLPAASCMTVGRFVVPGEHPALAWIVGTHIIAFIIAPPLALLTYMLAARLRRRAETETA